MCVWVYKKYIYLYVYDCRQDHPKSHDHSWINDTRNLVVDQEVQLKGAVSHPHLTSRWSRAVCCKMRAETIRHDPTMGLKKVHGS